MEPPPSYQAQPSAPPIRPLNLSPSIPTASITPDECIAHLKLLSAIADLRDTISRSDGLFGVHDSQIERFGVNNGGEQHMAKALALLREKRWGIYVCRAVERFTVWMERCVRSGRPATVGEVERGDGLTWVGLRERIPWTVQMMPPLGEFSLVD